MAMRVIGSAWYRPQDWQRLRQISADAQNLEDSHRQWRDGATRAVGNLERTGVRIRKVIIDLDELIAFCKKEAIPINGAARSRFVAWKVAQEEKSGQSNES